MTHTPGPWTVDHELGQVVGPNGVPLVAQVHTVLSDGPEAAANARLIAAAPDLLDALRGAMFFVPVGTLARERADAAIAKATEED